MLLPPPLSDKIWGGGRRQEGGGTGQGEGRIGPKGEEAAGESATISYATSVACERPPQQQAQT